VRMNWIQRLCIVFAISSALTSTGSEAADAEAAHAAPSVSTSTFQSPLYSVYCSSTENCLAIGQQYAATTSDFGRTWKGHRTLHDGAVVGTMACPTSHECVAVGVSAEDTPQYDSFPHRALVLTTTSGGGTWTREPPLSKDVGGLNDISCPSKTYCLAVGTPVDGTGGLALVTTNLGRTWRRLSLPKGVAPEFVTCFTPRA
jgi:photosystem II stability/assembly factor-like uncharacterized protein